MLDLNQATQEELDAIDGLKGHGPEIVRYREERGGFSSLRELDEVPGLTGKVDEETKAQLRVGQGKGDQPHCPPTRSG